MIPLLVWEKVGYYIYHEKHCRLMREFKQLCRPFYAGGVQTYACLPNYLTFGDRILGDRGLENSCGFFTSGFRYDITGPNVKCKCKCRNGLLNKLSNWVKGYGQKPSYMDCRMKYKRSSNVCDKEIVIVGRLPDRYMYSSGMLSPNGYKEMAKVFYYYYSF
jgi:hypothetical protein